MDFWIWIVIMVVVALAKGWGKLTEQVDADTENAPAPKPAQRRPARPRPVQPPPIRQATPPPKRHAQPAGERVTQTRFARGIPQPLVAYAAPAHLPRPIAHTPAAAASAAAFVKRNATKGSLWAEALRDRKNLRHVIIGNEIINRPLALRETD